MSDFGAGPFLTQDLDFEVTTTGDIKAVEGIEELQKDVAVQALIQLDDMIGLPQDNRTKAKIKSRVRRLLNDEPRINAVLDITVRYLTGANQAEVVALVYTLGREQELVFAL